jgi:hypothetical protein
VPMWADPEDPTTLSAAVAAAEERYLMAPSWLMFGFYPRGSKGWWLPDPMAAGTVQQVRVRVASFASCHGPNVRVCDCM